MTIKLDLKIIEPALNIQMLSIFGKIEDGYITPLSREFTKLTQGPAVQLILDVHGALGITGSGITELINARNHIVERGGAVVLIGVNKRIEKMINVSGLKKYFPIVSTEVEALQIFKEKRTQEANETILRK